MNITQLNEALEVAKANLAFYRDLKNDKEEEVCRFQIVELEKQIEAYDDDLGELDVTKACTLEGGECESCQ